VARYFVTQWRMPMSSSEPRRQPERIYDASGRLVQVIESHGQHTRITYYGRLIPDDANATEELPDLVEEALECADFDNDLQAHKTVVYESPGYREAQAPPASDALPPVDDPRRTDNG
jgi:hypothetical protein